MLRMKDEETSENSVAIMDWQKFTFRDQEQLHNKQKKFAPSAYGLFVIYQNI